MARLEGIVHKWHPTFFYFYSSGNHHLNAITLSVHPQDYFSRVGSVKFADVLREGGPGSRSKGCGIVEFETPEEAAAAIQQLNHTELNGRQIFVREDREDFELRGADGPKRLRGGGGGGSAVSIGRRVWAGNLNAASTWKDLKDHFKTAGKVLHADIMVDSEGRSKGCGIVEFEHPADALRAISLLSNSILNDRQIMVREDREDPGARGIHPAAPPRRSVGFGGFGGGGGAPVGHPPAPEGTQVVVHGIHYRMAWQDLKDLCRAAGPVVRADVMTNPDGTSKGYGVVVFTSQRDADNAISMLNGLEVEGRVLTCKYDRFASGRSYQD